MEFHHINHSTSSSSSSSCFNSFDFNRPLPSSTIHSSRLPVAVIHKPISKPKKKKASPNNIPPPKIHKVEPVNFMKVVQELTGETPRLHNLAPPPLELVRSVRSPPPLPPMLVDESPVEMPKWEKYSYGDSMSFSNRLEGYSSPLDPWISFPILSPATLASLEANTAI
ncbi:VQ protein [Dillenia turbinata]|uniref:VQ protein n=1 Tax=Dillenia turbinata TaxID=194707 RepID=A0AAN8ZJA0_9MAGN